jgi:hypothetical protein
MPPNLLANPDFAEVGPAGIYTTFTGDGGAGNSAAAHWTLWNNGPATIETELVTGSGPSGKTSLLRVATTGQGSGLVQVFGSQDTGPGATIASAWIYVVRGKVGIGTGNGGNTSLDITTLSTGRWELLRARNGVSPANEFIIYSEPSAGATFYVDSAEVLEAPDLPPIA